jgi:hypothetical protein
MVHGKQVFRGCRRDKMGTGICYFWLGKWDFMHWEWDSSALKQYEMGMGLRFEQESH